MGKRLTRIPCRGTFVATQLAAFVERVTTEAAMICAAHQLERAHKLGFVLEAVKMFYTLLLAARNSGAPFNTTSKIFNGRLGDIIALYPLPATIYALLHVAGTAAMAGIIAKQRHSVTLANSAGRLQFACSDCIECRACGGRAGGVQ